MRLTVYTNDLRTIFCDVLSEYDIDCVDDVVDRLIDALEREDGLYQDRDREDD